LAVVLLFGVVNVKSIPLAGETISKETSKFLINSDMPLALRFLQQELQLETYCLLKSKQLFSESETVFSAFKSILAVFCDRL
jgi:hypothetical protein